MDISSAHDIEIARLRAERNAAEQRLADEVMSNTTFD
jgi:hypothetical protein